jgi:manganese oxidase
MYLSRRDSNARVREAQKARENRLEIVKALADGQITRRDLLKWGIFTTAALLAPKNGLSPYARSAFAASATGAPPSPIPAGIKFTAPMPRLADQQRLPLRPVSNLDPLTGRRETDYAFLDPASNQPLAGLPAKRSSYHSYYAHPAFRPQFTNPITGLGPVEGRPPARADGDFFAHQRWDEFQPHVGYLLSLGQAAPGSTLHPGLPAQDANAVWAFGKRFGGPSNASSGPDTGKPAGYYGFQTGALTPPLLKMRYNEPVICRIHNDLPVDRTLNGGFGRNEITTHCHNGRNAAASNGACNAHHFPGTFYDYHWSASLARRDWRSYASAMDAGFNPAGSFTPDGKGGLEHVEGDGRECQGTLWFHDHRFFFAAQNVYKGGFGMLNMYSGADRGNEAINDGVNLMLPSGTAEDWGNTDYDINLAITNPSLDPRGQLVFDIFNTDGFLGDILAVNGAYYPYFEVKARRYRFRLLNASVSRFVKLAVVDQTGRPFPFHFIANDGNFVVKPILISDAILDEQGTGERYDIVIDFAKAKARGATSLFLINLLQQTDGRKPDGAVSVRQAMNGVAGDPAVGPMLEFRIGAAAKDPSADFFDPAWGTFGGKALTAQIPVQAPVRERTIEFMRGRGDSRDTLDGQCIPDCGDIDSFPWTMRVDGGPAHSLNANRVGALVVRPGDVEKWTLINGGAGWDKPVHMHLEEGLTLDRGGELLPLTEKLVRKDVWRLRPSGRVSIQLRFGEFGGAYALHCQNLVHGDCAQLMRYQLLLGTESGGIHGAVTPTPIPSEMGVTWKTPEILPEANSRG